MVAKMVRWRGRLAGLLGVLVVVGVGLVVTAAPASAAVGWRGISTGYNSTCGVKLDGTLWCWGDNTYGKLGVGDSNDRLVPTRVGTHTTWWEVWVGYDHACGRKESGVRYCWGSNEAGKLGLGSGAGSWVDTPQKVDTDPEGGWRALTVGRYHSCGITATGRDLYCWGAGWHGLLGLGDGSDRNLPTLVDSGTWSPYLSAGYLHTCALKENGDAYCWGDNQYGQLSTGDTTDRDEPDEVGDIRGSTEWTAITAGAWHTCGIRDSGQLFCWGRNSNAAGSIGILGTGYNTSPVRLIPTDVLASDVSIDWRDVDAGMYHTCAVTTSDWIYCWGDTSYGQVATYIDCYGCSRVRTSPTGPFMFHVDEIDAGGDHSCAIEDDDDLWCWGRNSQGQLGLGDRNYGHERWVPSEVV